MTVVEFYDKDQINNIASTLLFAPEQVIFITNDREQAEASVRNYREVLDKRNIKTRFKIELQNSDSLSASVDKLTKLVGEYDEVYFDLEGGDDLFLVAAGIVFERFRDKVKLRRYNFRNGSLYDCDANGTVCRRSPISLTAEEYIRIYGGRVVRSGSYFDWDFNSDFCRDIGVMWRICSSNSGGWNYSTGILAELCRHYMIIGTNEFYMELDAEYKRAGRKFREILSLLDTFSDNGLILDMKVDDALSFRFKNDQVRQCITKAGQLLELYIASVAMEVKGEDGYPLFTNVMVGVNIDWDGVVKGVKVDVVNEIDVVMMKGTLPVFVSCKNGNVDSEESYKLEAVATRFGGEFGRKLLVASDMNKAADAKKERFTEMGIVIIDNVDRISERKLAGILRKISEESYISVKL